jgi:hypothetical protein
MLVCIALDALVHLHLVPASAPHCQQRPTGRLSSRQQHMLHSAELYT